MSESARIAAELQSGRLVSLIAQISEHYPNHRFAAYMALAMGMQLARQYPEEAAAILVEMDPPEFIHALQWVVYGSPQLDPSEPVN